MIKNIMAAALCIVCFTSCSSENDGLFGHGGGIITPDASVGGTGGSQRPPVGGSGGFIFPDSGVGGFDGGLSDGGEPPVCESNLVGRVRDFKEEHPDFESVSGDDRGMILETLGEDDKPIYAGNPTTPTTNGAEYFNQWYRDVEGVNQGMDFKLEFVKGADGIFTYSNSEFFPIDDQLFGNEGHRHNYHFTYEFNTTFKYNGGEVFTFTGDDDVFTFINRKLAVDLGGVHVAQTASINLDDEAERLGLAQGKIYELHFFFAERHLVESNFRIDTTLVFLDCGKDPE